MKKQFCQSCGMPMKKESDFGTETDGSYNTLYCTYCYTNGHFTQDFKTVKEMKDFVIQKLVEKKFPKWLAKIFTSKIDKLKRWS